MYEHGLEDASAGAIVEALSALDLAKDGNEAKARDRLSDRGAAKLAAPGWMPSWMAAQTQIVLAQAHLQLGDASTARGLERAARRTIQEGARMPGSCAGGSRRCGRPWTHSPPCPSPARAT